MSFIKGWLSFTSGAYIIYITGGSREFWANHPELCECFPYYLVLSLGSGCSISTVTFQAPVSSSCRCFFFFLNCAKSPLSGNLPQQACRTHPFRNVFFSPECTLLSGHPSYSQPIYVKVKLPSKSRGCILKCIQSPSQKTKRPSPRKHHPHFEVLRCTYCCADMEMRILVFELPGLTNSLQTGSKCFVLLTQSLGYKWALITHMFSHCYLA